MKKLVTAVLIVLLVSSMLVPALGTEAESIIGPDTIALHLGSPLILDGEDMIYLDPNNPNVVPIIHKDRTLIPLRALAEHFGGEVSYDSDNREAIISYDGKDYFFPIDENHYRIEADGISLGTVVFDTESLIMNDRTMVPLRVICEKVLGKTVGYSDRVITVGPEEVNLDEKTVEEIKSKIGQALQLTSLDELKEILATMEGDYYRDDIMEEGISDTLAPAVDSEKSTNGVESEALAESSADGDYSSTNEQVEGVNESDIVKTDGKFIYVATSKSIKIYDARKGIPLLVDQIESEIDSDTGEYTSFSDLYVSSGRLVVLGTRNSFNNWIQPIPEVSIPESDEMISIEVMPYRQDSTYVYCGIYSIDDSGNADLMKEVDLEGSLLSSRKKDDTLYLVVNKYVHSYGYDDIILPMYRDSSTDEDFRQISYDKVMYYPKRSENNYLIIAAIDIEEKDTQASINAFLGSGRTIYMSNDNLYIANTDYSRHWGQITNIARFTIDEMKIGFAGGGLVEGTILNQFSMDEYQKNLRVATSGWDNGSTNSLFILDENMKTIGSIEDIAPGERIYSTRFMGEKGYIVTFRQIDPLFVIDLSDPEDPEIKGELKVPGFSNYLHPLGENTLLGIGRDVDEDTGRQGGIKLSIFDVSDQGKPKEINNLILGDSGSYAEVLNNHKALMLNNKDDMLAFDARLSTYSDKYEYSYFNGGVVIEANENGKLVVLEKISSEGIYASDVKRLLYIGDYLYYILDDNIRTFDIDTFEEMK
jgi:uncharacterized secreted protein with C-terminal beta-propeller domain